MFIVYLFLYFVAEVSFSPSGIGPKEVLREHNLEGAKRGLLQPLYEVLITEQFILFSLLVFLTHFLQTYGLLPLSNPDFYVFLGILRITH